MEPIGRGFRKFFLNPQMRDRYHSMITSVMENPEVNAFLDSHKEQITEDMIKNSYTKLYEFVQEKEKLAAGKEAQNPGYEPELVLNAGYIDVVYRPTEDTLRKEKERELRARIQSHNIPKAVREATMEKFLPTGDRLELLHQVYDFIESYDKAPRKHHQALYLYGPYGVGKTYLLGALAYELSRKGYNSTLVHYPSFAQEMKAAIADNSVMAKLDVIKKSPILMLDDIGAETNSTWVRDEVLGVILQYRMQEELPTFFSSNFDFEELEEHLRTGNRGDVEYTKAQRLMERVRYLAKEVRMTGKNRRMEP